MCGFDELLEDVLVRSARIAAKIVLFMSYDIGKSKPEHKHQAQNSCEKFYMNIYLFILHSKGCCLETDASFGYRFLINT